MTARFTISGWLWREMPTEMQLHVAREIRHMLGHDLWGNAGPLRTARSDGQGGCIITFIRHRRQA